jgi:hypothetical protein
LAKRTVPVQAIIVEIKKQKGVHIDHGMTAIIVLLPVTIYLVVILY